MCVKISHLLACNIEEKKVLTRATDTRTRLTGERCWRAAYECYNIFSCRRRRCVFWRRIFSVRQRSENVIPTQEQAIFLGTIRTCEAHGCRRFSLQPLLTKKTVSNLSVCLCPLLKRPGPPPCPSHKQHLKTALISQHDFSLQNGRKA